MILLSICIPTYNRAIYLQRTLESIVQQDRFINFNDIEIIISDNCSEDSTELISKQYVNLYPGKIFYYRNKVNIEDKNFQLALSRARGQYLKLNNDYLQHFKNSLEVMTSEINESIKDKPNLFFTNGALKSDSVITGSGKDEFLYVTSHYSTWIGMYGIWKSDFESLRDFNRSSDLNLVQFDNIYRVINIKKYFVLVDFKIFENAALKPIRKYDLLTIFFDNYYKILSLHAEKSEITTKTLSRDRRKVLLTFICGWAARSSHRLEASFNVDRHWSRVFEYCRPNLLLFFIYILKYMKNWLTFFYDKKFLKK